MDTALEYLGDIAMLFGGMRNDFQKEDCQGENPFAKGFSPWTLFPKTPILLRRKEEK